MRWAILFLLLPLALAYPISDYTGGDVFIPPGQRVTLTLPFPEGKNCLPVAVLFVKGGEDYPRMIVNGVVLEGEGTHRLILPRSARVEIVVESNGPAYIEGNSLIYCTTDPFVLIKNIPPEPVLIGNYNYQTIVLTNAGYSDVNIVLSISFHPNVAPYHPPLERIHIPARKSVAYTLFEVGAPRFLKPAAHGEVCVDYDDSVMHVHHCTRPIPGSYTFSPLVKCVGGVYINASNLVLEVNGKSLRPGDTLPEGVLTEFSEQNLDIVEIPLIGENEVFGGKRGPVGLLLIVIGAAMVVGRAVGFI